MNVEINSWLNASQDKGNPNVDGTDVNIICSTNTGNARSDYFEIMAGVIENGEIVDELRERVSVTQQANTDVKKGTFIVKCRFYDVNTNDSIMYNKNLILAWIDFENEGLGKQSMFGIEPVIANNGYYQYTWTKDITSCLQYFDRDEQINGTLRIQLSGTYMQSYSQADASATYSIETESTSYSNNKTAILLSGQQSVVIEFPIQESWYPEDDKNCTITADMVIRLR